MDFILEMAVGYWKEHIVISALYYHMCLSFLVSACALFSYGIFSQVWRNLVKMLKGTHGGKHGKRFFIKTNGGLWFSFLMSIYFAVTFSVNKSDFFPPSE